MKLVIDKKIVAFLLALALCVALTQPILAYMGGELPELPENTGVETAYATSGICVVSGFNELSVYGNVFRLTNSGRGWSCKNWGNDSPYEYLDDLIDEISDEYGDLGNFDTVVLDTEAGMRVDDWYSLLLLKDLLPGITSLTINGLTHVEENAFTYEEFWPESLSLPDVQSIGKKAFENCDSLVAVSLPKVTSIGDYAFDGSGLQELCFEDIDVIELGKNVVPLYKQDNPLTVYYTSGDWNRFGLAEQARYVNPVKIDNGGESSAPDESSSEPSAPDESSSESSAPDESSSESSAPDESSSESSVPDESSSEPSAPDESSSESSVPDESSSEPSAPDESSSESSVPDESSSESSAPDESSSESSAPDESSSESSAPDESSSEPSAPDESSSEPSEPDSPPPPTSSSQASSQSASSQPAKPAATGPAAVDNEEITQAVQAIIAAVNGDAAVENGGNSVKRPLILRFQNKNYITLAQLREIARASDKAGVKITVHADTKVGNTVVNRLYIDPAKASRGIRLMTGEGATAVLRRFEHYTENALAVLSLGQQNNFGMKVGVAFKLPLPEGVDEKKLAIYSFNPETGKYKRIFVPNKRVEPGYLWIQTDRAGFIVVSNGTLKRSR